MLPITNHKVVHVPHALAVIAALIGLIAALSWDHQSTQSEVTAAPQAMIAKDSKDHDELQDAPAEESDPASNPQQSSQPSGGQQWGSNGVFPLFLPVSQDR